MFRDREEKGGKERDPSNAKRATACLSRKKKKKVVFRIKEESKSTEKGKGRFSPKKKKGKWES